jgi:hypothetical protein
MQWDSHLWHSPSGTSLAEANANPATKSSFNDILTILTGKNSRLSQLT